MMREVEVKYKQNPWLDMHLYQIKKTPLYWKNSLEILWVLKGEIKLVLDNEEFMLKEGDMELINPMELRSFEEIKDNRLLMLDIKPGFFASYYPDAGKTLYYIDNTEEGKGRKYNLLKSYCARILYELNEQMEECDEALSKNLLELQYHLLNNFHYLYYEQEWLKEDPDELERFHRIVKYLSANYMEKVSLSEIAEKEFLNPSYLSYKIKDTMGLSFNEYLNQIRVEKSTKLLLGTDKSISEIAGEVGFSHPRYYLKHFINHYHMHPQEYRDSHTMEEMPSLEEMGKEYPLESALNEIKEFLTDYSRYGSALYLEKIRLDLNKESIGGFTRGDTILLGDATLFLEDENMHLLREVQREIHFKYGIILNLFSQDLDIFRGRGHRFINWTRVENILDFILSQKMEPKIYLGNTAKNVLESFTENFSKVYDRDVTEWFLEELPKGIVPPTQEDENFDKTDVIPWIYDKVLDKKEPCIPSLVDYIDKETELSNDTFFGGGGMFTSNALNKAGFYAWKLLAQLGDEVLVKEPGLIFTRSNNGYQILLYSYKKKDKTVERRVMVNLLNMERNYSVTRFLLDAQHGSIYDKWEELGAPERIDTLHWTLLDEYVHPKVDFYYGKKSKVYPFFTKIQKNGAVLYLFNEI